MKFKALIIKLNQFDLFAKFVLKLFKGKVTYASISIGIATTGLWWLAGTLIRALYPCKDIIQLTDPDELSFGLFIWAVFVPVLWWYYLSLPNMWGKMAQSLRESGVVEGGFFNIVKTRSERSYNILSLTIAVVVIYLYFTYSVPAEIISGRTSFFFVTSWSRTILGLMIGFHSYIFLNFVLKTLFLILGLRNHLEEKGVINVCIVHVDKCGGLGSIGSLAIRISSLAIVVGLWAVWYSILPLLGGGNTMNYSITVWMLYFAYVVLAPLLLLSLIMPASRAMKRYKSLAISEITQTMREKWNTIILKSSQKKPGHKHITRLLEDYKELSMVYEQMDKLPEWPIRPLNLKRFTSAALLPALFGIASFALDVLDIASAIREIVK